jgi:hypothetical protein
MRIQTAEDLNDALSAELAWRRKELHGLRSVIRLNPGNNRDSLIRCGVTVLYAHWEGFVKTSSTAYLEYVSRRQLRYAELRPNFVALALRPQLNAALSTSRVEALSELVEFLLTKAEEKTTIQWRNAVNTKSNLSSKVFRQIVATLGLDYSYYASKEKLLDERLLLSRNNIAHGKYLLVDEDAFMELYDEVLEIMSHLRTQIDNAASTLSFRRNSQVAAVSG